MAKRVITGIALRGDEMEWTTLQGAGGRFEKAASGSIGGSGSAVPAAPGEIGALKGDVTVGLSSEQLFLRVVQLPIGDEAELAGMVQLQMDKFSPFPVESMVVSHEVLVKDERNATVLIAAARKDAVDAVISRLDTLGLKPSRLDVGVMGWWHVMAERNEFAGKGRRLVFVLDRGSVDLMVLEGGYPILLRSMGVNSNQSESELAESVVGESAQTLMWLELERGAESKPGIVVWHRGAAPHGLVERLRDACGVQAVCMALDTLPSLSEGLARRFAGESGTELDLTPAEWRSAVESGAAKRQVWQAGAIALGCWLIAACIFAGGFIWQKSRLKRLEASLKECEAPAQRVLVMKKKLELLKRYLDRSGSALDCLAEISEVMPDRGLKLTSFSYRKGDAVKISGEADSRSQVLELNEKLNESSVFTKVMPGPEAESGGRHRFLFELKLPAE